MSARQVRRPRIEFKGFGSNRRIWLLNLWIRSIFLAWTRFGAASFDVGERRGSAPVHAYLGAAAEELPPDDGRNPLPPARSPGPAAKLRLAGTRPGPGFPGAA